jgi:copper resistance protein B
MGHCKPATKADPDAATLAGTDQPAGDAPPPAAPTTRAAARFYDPAAMAQADRSMRDMHGGMRFSQVIFNLAEAQVQSGRDGYRWDGEGWFGGDIHRLVVKSEGEGGFGDRVDTAEVQALYARALDPYWNLQAGVRQDLGAGARRTYAVIGVEGLAPYWFDVEGALFLSDKGDVLARAEAWYDQRITQRAILQPRVELNLAAQDMPDSRIGAGLSSAEFGIRLRYELRREFAPYVGVSWERRYGATARYARSDGERTGGIALALGVRGWF